MLAPALAGGHWSRITAVRPASTEHAHICTAVTHLRACVWPVLMGIRRCRRGRGTLPPVPSHTSMSLSAGALSDDPPQNTMWMAQRLRCFTPRLGWSFSTMVSASPSVVPCAHRLSAGAPPPPPAPRFSAVSPEPRCLFAISSVQARLAKCTRTVFGCCLVALLSRMLSRCPTVVSAWIWRRPTHAASGCTKKAQPVSVDAAKGRSQQLVAPCQLCTVGTGPEAAAEQ